MPAIGSIGDYPLASYSQPFMAAGVGRSMVKDTLTGTYPMQLSPVHGETMAMGRLGVPFMSLALRARGLSGVELRAFIAYTQQFYASSVSVAIGHGVKVFSQPLIGLSGLFGKSHVTISPLAHMPGRVITAVKTLPGPPFIATFLIISMSKVSARGYRTIWQYLQGRSESKTFSVPGMVFEQFLWAARSSIKAMGRVAWIGELPMFARATFVSRARRSLGVSPLTMPGAVTKFAFQATSNMVRHVYLQGRAKGRLVDGLAAYVGKVYFHVISSTITRVRLYVSGRVQLPHIVSLTKVSMRSLRPQATTRLTGHSDTRNVQETAAGRFLTLALITVSTISHVSSRGVTRSIAYLTGHSEAMVRDKSSRLFSLMGIKAWSAIRGAITLGLLAKTQFKARTKSIVESRTPVIFGTFTLFRTRSQLAVKVVSGTMVAKLTLRGASSIKGKAQGLTRYAMTLAARARSRVVGKLPIPPFQLVNLSGARSRSMSAIRPVITYFSTLTASSWQALMGNITPMTWPLLPNMQPGRHVCNSHPRVRYLYRNLLDQEVCECQD